MKEIALYVHVPFCKLKCKYCDFPSFCGKEKLVAEYIKALKKEIKYKCKDYRYKTIFIGGGTPTFLNYKELEEILSEINKLDICDDYEFTVECNPGSVDEEKLKLLKKYKVNRLSFGLQSTFDKYLKTLGRIHTYDEFKENYYLARKVGFTNINIDLMFGIPNENLDEWKETLNEIIKLEPEHISAYSLIIEEGTPFHRLYEEDKLELPSEEEEREMYKVTKEILNKAGYLQYEISNYSKMGMECKHNIVYWQLKDYLGVGSSSASYIDSQRLTNTPVIEEYIKNINEGNYSGIESHYNSIEENIEEYMFLGLRMIQGINKKIFKEKFGVSVEEIYKDIIEKYVKSGFLVNSQEYLYLSPKGIEVSNAIMSEFLLT